MLVYKTSPFQKILFRDAQIGEAPEAAKGLADYGRFIGDIFGRAYSADGLQKNEPTPGLAVYEQLHKSISEIPGWGGLVERTRNDSFLAGIVASQIGQQVAEVLPEGAKVGSSEGDTKLEKTLAEMLAGMDPESLEAQDVRAEMKAAADRASEAVAASEELAGVADSAGFRNALRAAIESAKGEIDGICGGYSAFGCDPMAPDAEKRRMMGLISDRIKQNPKLAEIAKLAGRLQRMMEGMKEEEIGKTPAEIVGVIQGSDIGRLLPSELAKLAATPKLFFKDMMENQLLQYKSRRVEEKGRGPLVVCVDHSGSMKQGSRHLWASAIAVALMLEAREAGRPFAVCLFNGGIADSWAFSTGPRDVASLLDLVSRTPAGGTSISGAVSWAMGQVATEPKADVVILSDGDDRMSPEQITGAVNWKAQTGAKILAIRVAGDPSYKALDEISDRLWTVADFADAAKSLLAEVVKK